MLKTRGADEVYDYVREFPNFVLREKLELITQKRSPNVGERIREETDDKLATVFDTVTVPSSVTICASAIGSGGGTYCNLLDVDCPREDVKSVFFLGYSLSGEEYIFEGETYPAQPQDFAFATKWYELAEKVWAHGRWKPHPQRVGVGGLRGVLDGLQEMREGKVSGEKLVYLL